MGDWRMAAEMALGGGSRFREVSESITSGNLQSETRVESKAEKDVAVYSVYSVYNCSPIKKAISDEILLKVEKYEDDNDQKHVEIRPHSQTHQKKPDKPDKPPTQVNPVSSVYSVCSGEHVIDCKIVVAVMTGDPTKIAAAVACNPDLLERAAIREIEGNMSRLDAELSTLLDAIGEVG
jgi:hypothetical protein